jgi:hypothetical protein
MMPRIGPVFIPKSGILATFQFFKYKLYRGSNESTQEWARRIHETVSQHYKEGSWKMTSEPLSFREFALYTWTCLVEIAKELASDDRVKEYKQAKMLLARTCAKNAFLKPVAYGALLAQELIDKDKENSFVERWADWGEAYEELWKIGINILGTYVTNSRLMPLSEASQYTENEHIKELLSNS